MKVEMFESVHKVRSYECDIYGHVNNATYLNYLEFARMEVLEQKGLTLEKLQKEGFLIVIRRIDIEYKSPAVATEQLLIRTHLKSFQRTSGIFHQQIVRLNDNKEIAKADVTWVIVNTAGRPVRIPPIIRNAFGIQFGKGNQNL